MKQLAVFVLLVSAAIAADRSAEWNVALKNIATYEQGQSHAGPTAVENHVRAALGNTSDRAALEQRLATFLGSGATVEGKRFVCRQLALIGSAASVPALAALLTDPELADMARYALEAIPDPAVDQALLAALPKAGGKQKSGIIASLGARRTTAAVGPLGRLTTGSDGAVARAAGSALEKIHTAASLEALLTACRNASEPLRPHFTDCALSLSHAMLARGAKHEAAQAFVEFYQSSETPTVRATALKGLLAADPVKYFPFVLTILRGEADPLQPLAADLLRTLPDKKVVSRVVAELPKMSLRVQALVLTALAERGDKAALSVALGNVTNADDSVAAAACACVGALGGADQVGPLVELLGNPDRVVAARGALTRLRGAQVDAAILKSRERKPPKVQVEVMRILVARNAVSLVPSLLQMAESPTLDRPDAVFHALGSLAGEAHLPALVKLAVQAHAPEACERVENALTEAVTRLDDTGKWSQVILGQYVQAAGPARCGLLRVLRFSGDPRALALVREELKSGEAAVSQAAFRAMTDWPTAGPVNDLLQLTREGTNLTRRLLAFRGAVRMAELTAASSAGSGVALLRSAMEAAPRVEDKRLVLGALMSAPTTEALQMAQACLDDPKLVNEASVAVLKIADAVGKRQPEVARKAVEQVLSVTKNEKLKKQAQALLGKLGSPTR